MHVVTRLERLASALVLVIVLAACPGGERFIDDLERWELPNDLTAERLGRLERLSLSGEIDHLRWLRPATSLETLVLDGTAVDETSGLPSSLLGFAVYGQHPIDLGELPNRLTSLTVSYSTVRGAERIGELAALERLRIEGPSPGLPLTLPRGLQVLELIGYEIEVDDLRLPPSLAALTLDGSDIEALGKLPETLTTVRLGDTGVGDLGELPSGVRSLYLRHNTNLDLETLPKLLTSLTLVYQDSVETSALPPQLLALEAEQTQLLLAADGPGLPASLEVFNLSTQMDEKTLSALLGSVPDLTTLRLDTRTRALPARLPSNLRRLTVVSPPAGFVVPANLRELELVWVPPNGVSFTPAEGPLPETAAGERLLAFEGSELTAEWLAAALEAFGASHRLALRRCRLDRLPDLSATSIVSLDLTGSTIGEFDPERLPAGLEELRLAASSLEVLPALPELRVLDVSNTRIGDLSPLGEGTRLEELTIHQGQLQALAAELPKLRALAVVRDEGVADREETAPAPGGAGADVSSPPPAAPA